MIERSQARVEGVSPPALLSVLSAVVLVIVVMCSVNAVGRIGQPFAGFFVWDNGFVPAVGEAYWTGSYAGLKYHSWLVEAGGQPVSDQKGLEGVLADRKPGDLVRYTLVRNQRRYTIEAAVMRMDLRAWISVLGIYVFDAIALLALGLVVLYMKPHDPAAQALALVCVISSAALATATDLFGPSRFRIPYFFFINLIPFTVMNLLSRFPVGRPRRAWEDRALAAIAVAGVGLGLALNVAFTRDPDLTIRLDRLTYGLLAASGLSAMGFFCWRFVIAPTPLVRDRLKIVLLGTFGAWLLPVIVFALYGWGVSFPFNVMAVSIVLFPIGIGYAIARHDLFHIDRVIKRTLVYFALSALVVGLYTVSITAVEVLFDNLTDVASRVVQAVLILLLLLISQPSRVRIQDVVDRIYDRRRYSYRDAVGSASRAFATILDFDELVRTVLDLIDETLQPEFACVYTVTAGAVPHPRGRLYHASGSVRRIELESAAIHELAAVPVLELLRNEDLVMLDEAEELDAQQGSGAARGAFGTRNEALRAMGASLVTAMRLEGRLVGMISVGPKRAGSLHNADDVDLLRTISDQLAIALENASAYKRIDRLNRDLESNYRELERTHQELTETQVQLLQKERLAAIGELSGAVAHAIRNPLAGIKAAAQLAELELEESPARATVADIISETDRLNDRIGALLDFARPYEPDAHPMSLNVIADRAVRGTVHKAAEKRVELSFEADDDIPNVEIDPVLFEEAAAELVSNAVEITPESGRVTVRTGASGNGTRDAGGTVRVWLEVTDTGPGIRTDKKPRIFDIFFTTKPGGTGFGLATVKKIVERHGGTVTAENVEPTGARFRIELPACAV